MTPIWRQAFNAWEKAASPVLQQTATSPAFRDFMRVGTRINKSVAAEFEQASRQWLHAMNLPAATDLHRLRSQVRELEMSSRVCARPSRLVRPFRSQFGLRPHGTRSSATRTARSTGTRS